MLFMKTFNLSLKNLMGLKLISENSPTTNVGEHVSSSFSMSTASPFKSIGSKHDVYRGKDCMKNFCKSLREHAMAIINFKNKKLKTLKNDQQKSHENAKICYIFFKKLTEV